MLLHGLGGSLNTPNTWLPSGHMTIARVEHTAALLPNGHMLVAGGFTGYMTCLINSAEVYDPRTGRWTATAGMSVGRAGHTATLLTSRQGLEER